MRTSNKQILTAQALNANITTTPFQLKNVYMYSVAFNVTGTPTGVVKLQASNDPETNDSMPSNNPQPSPSNWADITNSSFTLSAAGETMWNVSSIAYNWVRVVYTDNSSGASTATVNCVINVKGV